MTDGFNSDRHRIILKERKNLIISGIEDVDSFDEKTIVAMTKMGELIIRGDGLKILNMNTETGELSAEGENISSLDYAGEKTEGGFFKRLFK